MIKWLITVFALLALGNTAWSVPHYYEEAGEITTFRQGRYVGYIEIDGRKERIATEIDFFTQSPEDMTEFPRLVAILRLSMGGYNTHEYGSQVYKNIRSNFEINEFTLDEPTNDLVLTVKMVGLDDNPALHGRIWSRSSAVNGIVHLDHYSDEPDFESTQKGVKNYPFVPLLQGQYAGKCDGKDHVLQIQTVRGLGFDRSEEGIFRYEIVARIGARQKDPTSPLPWNVVGTFAGGVYNPFRGKLVFTGPSTTAIECSRLVGRLSCQWRIREQNNRCDFERVASEDIQPSRFFQRSFHLAPTADQLSKLPTDDPRDSTKLVELLDGTFYGNLHHESNDRYQPVSLRVIPIISTENPHNLNKVFISTTAVLHFGNQAADQFISHRYEPRSFYIHPGFALYASGTDSFILIEEWTKGFIRGVWYSHTFGRVGTVELIKDLNSPLPPKVPFVPTWEGQYVGIKKIDSGAAVKRWFHVIYTHPSAERSDSTVPFMGSYQPDMQFSKIEAMDRGRFDPYTGALGWVISNNGATSVISGRVTSEGKMLIHWPPAPGNYATWMGDLDFFEFKQTQYKPTQELK